MINRHIKVESWTCSITQYEDTLRSLGIAVLHCDVDGNLMSDCHNKDSWLVDLLVSSPLLQRTITSNVQNWFSKKGRKTIEAFHGVWISPARSCTGRSHNGFAVGVIVTQELLTSEYLYPLCQASNADAEVVTSLIKSLPPVAVSDVQRIGTMFQFAWDSLVNRSVDLETVESLGQELTDSYEEINLLYTITGSMNSVDYPDRFFELACNELLQTITYKWIGIQLNDMGKFSRRENDLYVVGNISQNLSQLSKEVHQAVTNIKPSSPIVFEGEGVSGDLGAGSIAVPIVNSANVIGVLVAGNKLGTDSMASSIDIQLLTATAAQLAIFLENALLYDDLNASFLGTLKALSASIDAKDPYTCGHSQRVALLTAALARAAGLEEEHVDRFHIAGIVHDIGKIGVPESVLLKDGKLTDDEFAKIRLHPEIGAKILCDIPHLEDIIEGVLHHHERFDGKGYPHGMAGTNIPLVARMIALADTFDAMSSSRTYRAAMTKQEVINEIKRVSGKQFDPELTVLFLNLDFSEWDKLAIKHHVKLSIPDGRKAA